MSTIIPFTFPETGQPVRTVTIHDEAWFVGVDVAQSIGLTDARRSLNLLDEDERNSIPVIDSLGRQQPTIVVNEPGLYSLILRSRKPQAKAFKRWITHEVIPSIRKTGRYDATPVEEQSSTVSWEQAAAMARLRYGLDVNTDELRELLNKGGILTNTGRPHKRWEHMFWPLPTRWEIHESVVPQLIAFAGQVRRDLARAEQELQMSLPMPVAALADNVRRIGGAR